MLLTSSVADVRSQFACDGQLVNFTCRVFGSNSLAWRNRLIVPISYSSFLDTPPVVTNRPPFRGVLTDVVGSNLNEANLTSTLEVNASRSMMMNSTMIVECASPQCTEESNFTVSG